MTARVTGRLTGRATGRPRSLPTLLATACCTVALLVTGCSGGGSPGAEEATPAESTSPGADGSEAGDSPSTEPERPSAAEQLGLEAGWGPSREALDRAARRTGEMSVAELAGRVIVARYDGTEAPVPLVTDLGLGGVIVFADNITSADQVRASNQRLRQAVDRPLLIGVDQEGGMVARVSAGVTPFPTFMTAGAADRPGLTRRAMRGLGADLADLGFSMDFAPVADVTTGPDDPTIGARSPGADPAEVAEHAIAGAEGLRDVGVLPVIKHFPGHGSVPADSHEELPVQGRSRPQLARRDLVPFERAAEAGLPAAMVGHIDVRSVDPGTPSSLSRPVVTGMLRRQLGFEGLVVTDALDMAGVAEGRTSGGTAVAALRAGADVLLMPPDPRAARDGIVEAVRGGDLPRRRLRQAAARQLALLADPGADPDAGTDGPVDSGEASATFSRGGITLAQGPCEGRLVGDSVRPVGDADAVAAFREAARRAGLGLGGGDTVAFTGFGGGPVTGDVAVATDAPYPLGSSTAPVRIATYGDTPGAMDALVDVLLGEAPAPGRLPVPVDGLPRRGC